MLDKRERGNLAFISSPPNSLETVGNMLNSMGIPTSVDGLGTEGTDRNSIVIKSPYSDPRQGVPDVTITITTRGDLVYSLSQVVPGGAIRPTGSLNVPALDTTVLRRCFAAQQETQEDGGSTVVFEYGVPGESGELTLGLRVDQPPISTDGMQITGIIFRPANGTPLNHGTVYLAGLVD